jgi:hypothetical protein
MFVPQLLEYTPTKFRTSKISYCTPANSGHFWRAPLVNIPGLHHCHIFPCLLHTKDRLVIRNIFVHKSWGYSFDNSCAPSKSTINSKVGKSLPKRSLWPETLPGIRTSDQRSVKMLNREDTIG